MRGKKAKMLRGIIQDNHPDLPERDYQLEKVKRIDGTIAGIIELVKNCQRSKYQKLKREYQLGVALA